MIKSRYLRHFAQFQKKIVVKDEFGEVNETFETIFTKYVDVRPVSVDEEGENNTTYQLSRLELSVRYSAQLESKIQTGDRVVIDNKPYSIDTINDIFSRNKLSYLISLYE